MEYFYPGLLQTEIWHKTLRKTRIEFYSEKLNKYKTDGKNLHKALKELSGFKTVSVYPTGKSDREVSEEMASFYIRKIEKIRETISSDTEKQKESETSYLKTNKQKRLRN